MSLETWNHGSSVVVVKVTTTGFSVAEDDVLHVGAQRLCAVSGRLLATFCTYVRPERQSLATFRGNTGFTELAAADLEDIPTVVQALVELSKFVGEDTIIAHRGPLEAMPVIREKCARHGLRVRPVRIMDSADIARKLLGQDARVNLRELAKRFWLVYEPRIPLSPDHYLKILGAVVRRMWALLVPENGPFPVAAGTGVLPIVEPL